MNDDLLSKLERLAKLKDQGILTNSEFEEQKNTLLKGQQNSDTQAVDSAIVRNPLLEAPSFPLTPTYSEPEKHKRSNTFGIISIVVGTIAYMTPKIFLSIVLIALAAFVIIGFIRDGSKIFSVIGLGLGLGIIYLLGQEAINSDKLYSIRYEVSCSSCDVTYTNETGGSDKESRVYAGWDKRIQAKGDQFLHISAQNNKETGVVKTRIYVDDILISEESASGEYGVASVSCQPQDVNKKY